jgi:hypothetical protein
MALLSLSVWHAQLLQERLHEDCATGSSARIEETYAEDFSCLLRFDRMVFDPARTKPLEIFPGYQNIVKNINPASTAVLAAYQDNWPAVYLGELTADTAGLNCTMQLSRLVG